MIGAVQLGCCAVCRRAEEGAGYSTPGRHRQPSPARITWVCNRDIGFAKTVHNMAKETLTRIEERALEAAGDAGGAYLDALGKTDLAALTKPEWINFIERMIDGFGASMRDQLAAYEAPF